MNYANALVATPGQTIGPFFGFALPYAGGPDLIPRNDPAAVRLTGRVLDGSQDPVPDAVLEIWQADAEGQVVAAAGSLRRDGYTFTGWGRASTDNTGRYSFTTLRPGPTEPGRLPFIAMVVFARGLTNRLFTRVYLPAAPDAVIADPVLGALPEDRRRTLLATEQDGQLNFDVVLQGQDETVFLSFPGPFGVTDLYWPGEFRAGKLMTSDSLVTALVRVEVAWYAVLSGAGVAPAVELPDESVLAELSSAELADLARSAESGGNPVIPLVSVLRSRLQTAAPEAAGWLHRGLTSQDAMDTALVLLLRDVLDHVATEMCGQVRVLRGLAHRHRNSLCAGRTLTQHAVPTTFGLQAANWLQGILDVADELRVVRRSLPVQVGGAAGTLAGIVGLLEDAAEPATHARRLADELAERLGLCPAVPWHTNRRVLTRLGDALVAATDAWGHVANDVLVRARPEVGELSEGGAGRSGSSTMPHKQNPVLSVLIRRAALSAPTLGAWLHTAAAAAVDERPDGGWHAEWAGLRTLARQTVATASQTTELVSGLVVHESRMRETAERAGDDLLAESGSLHSLRGGDRPAPTSPAGYLGATDLLIDAAVARADAFLTEAG